MDISNLLEKALNVRAAYHKVLAGNITNVETPGYREKEIDFKTELNRSISGSTDVEIKENVNATGSMDGNSVNMEDQIMKLNENTMMYNTCVQLINKRFSMLRFVINEGKR